MGYILDLPLEDAISLLNHAIEEEQKERFYQLWLVRYPNYDKNSFETFGDFYEKYKPQKVQYDMRSKDTLMAEILKIERKEE